ncbi:MFS general substrate transporter [Thermothelomyces heterothallicus CBS 203.75]
MSSHVLLAKLATFSDAFLSGLVLPIFPAILQHRTLLRQQIPPEALQIWISVAVSAYSGGFAVASPLIALLTRQGPGGFVVLLAGLALTAVAFALFQFSGDVLLLIAARALQGLAAAALTGASSGLLATAPSTGRNWLSVAFLQNVAMTTAPLIGGLLHDRYHIDAVFYSAYGLVALNVVLALLAAGTGRATPASSANERAALLASETQRGGYGTMPPTETGSLSGRSSRSVSPTSMPARSSRRNAPTSFVATFSWNPRLLVAFGGYLVLSLLTSALQSMLPLFVQRQYEWSVLAGGSVFVPLSAPAAVLGLLSGAIAARVPRSIRFLTTTGFLAYIPALLHLGQLEENTKVAQHAFLLTLGAISSAAGFIADPLVKEMTNAAGSSSVGDSWSATAQANAAPMLANAWGGLFGPVLAAALSYLYSWQFMTKWLAVIAAGMGAGALLFLQGWIANPYSEARARSAGTTSDEEAGPLLRGSGPNDDVFQGPEAYGGKEDRYARSDGGSSDARHDANRKHRPHRRHFSVDNFSVATTAGPGSMDSSTSSVRFQAALETPVQGRRRSEACDGTNKGSSTERRYVMREAPHAPATDPLLAAGSLYVIDEERDTAQGVERQRQNRRVVVFPEGAAPPELLARNRHHVVAINAVDGTAHMVSDGTDDHALHVTEEPVDDEAAFQEANCRRYVVVVVEGEDAESE